VARFFLELPHLNAAMFQPFIDAFAEAVPSSLNILLLDNSGAPTAERLILPDALAWLQFTTFNAQQAYISDLLQAYQAATLQSLTGYAYLVEAIHGLYI
jgi:hypothetical protein